MTRLTDDLADDPVEPCSFLNYVDLFVLLLFFALANLGSDLYTRDGQRPRSETSVATASDSKDLTVVVGRAGGYAMGGTDVTEDQLDARLKAAAPAGNVVVYIDAHGDAPHRRVFAVHEACRRHGLNYSFVVDPAPARAS